MQKYVKEYNLAPLSHCAVNCPFMRMDVIDTIGETDQSKLTPYCIRYQQRLFPEDEIKLRRANICTITKVEWQYYFEGDDNGKS